MLQVHDIYESGNYHWPVVKFDITNNTVLQQLARQAPAAQDAGGACLAGYYS